MADRIDPSLTGALRLTAAGPLTVRPLAQAPRVADVDARAGERLDSYQFTRPLSEPRTTLPTRAPAAAIRMVAATVPGGVNFRAEQAPASAALPMYRHPADRNAAATAVDAGRVLDVEA